jgi:hypothetical protein
MAVKYVRSTSSGTGDGSSWVNAYTTLAAALAAISAGDTVYVSQAHAETGGASITLTSPGTVGNMCRVMCANDGAIPPTALATGAKVATGAGAYAITIGVGYMYYYGIEFDVATGANAASFGAISNGSNNPAYLVLDTCKIVLTNTSASSRINLLTLGGSGANQRVDLLNTTLQFGSTSQFVVLGTGIVNWKNTASAIAGATIPTLLFQPATGTTGLAVLELTGVDLSALGSGKSIFAGGSGIPAIMRAVNSKLGASVAAMSGTIPNQGGAQVYLENCDSGATNTRMEHYKYPGSIKTETTKVRTTGGASDGTTPISHVFATLATGPGLFSPLEGPWMSIWNDTSGSAKTVTVELCTENVALYNDEVWLEVEYLGTSGYPESVLTTSRVADVFATHALLTTSAAAWSGFTTAAPQKIALAFTPALKGLIRARVCVAKASAFVYVDPLLTVS